jgi:hypothetical protein
MHFSRFRVGSGSCLALFACFALHAGPVPSGKPSDYPDWWFTFDVILRLPAHATTTPPTLTWPDHYPAADDFAAVNIGQLKYIAAQAAAEMDARLPAPGAGDDIDDLLATWSQSPPPSSRDDFAALNQGQLKYVAALFYDRLSLLGYVGQPLSGSQPYPWISGTTGDDDFALVNLGQLKNVFSFRVPGGSGDAIDTDTDGMPDAWEFLYWSHLLNSAVGDFDTDGANNATEYLQGRSPTKGVVADTSGAVALRVYNPAP